MDTPTLLFTAGIELGLAVGYGLCWIGDVRRMVLRFVEALGRV